MSTQLIIRRHGDAPDAAPLDQRTFDGPIITIGSDAAASLTLPGARIAPEQAIVINEDGHLLLISRADGTLLNDEPLARETRRPLADGDRLRLGDYVIIFRLTGAAPAAPGEGLTAAALSDAQRRRSGDAPTRLAETPPPSPQSPAAPRATAAPPANGEDGAQRNFAAILDSLRTEEDSFYFLVEGGADDGRRVPIGGAELPLGWDISGQKITFDAAAVSAPRAVVRKDWSGVAVQAHSAGMVVVNGELVESTRRLRNNDRLMIVPTATTAAQNQAFLVFHEPASLVVLDSLLPQKMPPPVLLPSPAEMAASLAQAAPSSVPAVVPAGGAKPPGTPRRVFGFFTPSEILMMLVGTLALAVLVFLLLEYL